MRKPLFACAILLLAGLAAPWALRAEILPVSGPLPARTMERLLVLNAVHIGNRVVAVGDRGYAVYSGDDGASWKRAKVNADAPVPLLTSVFFSDPMTGWAVGHDAVILATRDGGETWERQFFAPSEQKPLLDILFLDKNRGFAVGAYSSFYETADGGKTWSARKILNDDKHLNAIVRMGDEKVLIAGEAGALLRSDDGGKNWTTLESPYKGSYFGALVAEDGAVVIFGLRGKIFRSIDLGKSWKAIDNASLATLMGGTKLPDGTLVIAGSAGTVLVSRDNGHSFTPLATGSTRAYSKALLGSPNSVLLFGEAGVSTVAVASAKR
jgi:photosystem II stability/assembly factor-like uncharacterized protein